MVRAFELAGAKAELIHLDKLIAEPQRLDAADLVGFPGGFSYGDDIASGRIFAVRLRERLYPALRAAAARGCPMIGACNGFQVLVQVGLLPGPDQAGQWPDDAAPAQTCALAVNSGGSFIDRWVRVATDPTSVCIWTRGLGEAFSDSHYNTMMLPIAHGEGRFVADSTATLARLKAAGQVALRYVGEVNGSEEDIAGVCDASGRIFGLMPHPERYLEWTRHPYWTRLDARTRAGETPGMRMFRSAVEAVRGVTV